jgi:hypothetical protein
MRSKEVMRGDRMVWVFLGLVVFLTCSYVVTQNKKEKDVPLKNVDAYIVTAILSTLTAHGVISLIEETEFEGETLLGLKENLLEHSRISEFEWDEMVNDHLDSTCPFIDSKDLDIG